MSRSSITNIFVMNLAIPLSLVNASLAGNGVPAPIAGAFGPVGIAVAGVAYGGYRLAKYLRNRN